MAASDEFFAAKENLIKPTAPAFVPETYGARGQVYDGWETRRRRGPDRTLPDRTARDWVIVRPGCGYMGRSPTTVSRQRPPLGGNSLITIS